MKNCFFGEKSTFQGAGGHISPHMYNIAKKKKIFFVFVWLFFLRVCLWEYTSST